MFTNSSVGVVFWNKVFSSDTVSGYKCSHFLVTMHSLLLGIFIKKPTVICVPENSETYFPEPVRLQ